MDKGRLEAFSDSVIAVALTIMVLDLKAPEGVQLADLKPVAPVFLGYVLSFVYVGIYWTNHHHMLHTVRTVNGAILWANLHLLFWLCMVPFITAWVGEHPLAPVPVALYGAVLLMNAIAYTLLQTLLIRHEGPDGALAKATGADVKGKTSLILYVLGIGAAFVFPPAAIALYVVVAVIWFIPDRRVERQLGVQ
jgi:uncharacterized membrane protein